MDLGEDFERVKTGVVIVEMSGGDDFVGLSDFDESAEAAFDGFGRAYSRDCQRDRGVGLFLRRPIGVYVVDGRRNLRGIVAAEIGKGLLDRSELTASFIVCVRSYNVYSDHGMGLGQVGGRLEAGAVNSQSVEHVGWSEMRCKGKGQAE